MLMPAIGMGEEQAVGVNPTKIGADDEREEDDAGEEGVEQQDGDDGIIAK